MADPQVMAHLQTLELDVHEGTALFHLLDNGDGEALRRWTARAELDPGQACLKTQ